MAVNFNEMLVAVHCSCSGLMIHVNRIFEYYFSNTTTTPLNNHQIQDHQMWAFQVKSSKNLTFYHINQIHPRTHCQTQFSFNECIKYYGKYMDELGIAVEMSICKSK